MCRESGFTLIEVLIVMAISIVLALGGFLGVSGYRDRKNLEFSLNEVAAVVRETRNKSITQENGYRWGMRLMSSSTGFDTYEVFKGATYANGTTTATYSFRRSVEFSEPSNDRYIDLLFEPVSGKIDNRKIVSLVLKKGGSRAGDIIVNTLGMVTHRMEDDIVGYWHFDEGTGTSTYDASGNDNTGTLIGSPTWQSGSSCKAGGCLDFDNNWVRVLHSEILNLSDNITITMWFKIDGWTTEYSRGVIRKRTNTTDASYVTYYDGTWGPNQILMYANRGGSWGPVSGLGSIELDKWYHLAWTYQNGGILYLNGIQQGVETGSGLLATNTQNIMIGDGYQDEHNGLIDEVRIYNRALTASEIQAHYDDLK